MWLILMIFSGAFMKLCSVDFVLFFGLQGIIYRFRIYCNYDGGFYTGLFAGNDLKRDFMEKQYAFYLELPG